MKAVNLLPHDLRSGAKGPAPAVSAGTEDAGGPGPFIVLGALALCVVALAGYVLTSNAVKDRQATLAEVSARTEAVTRQVTALKPYADFEAMANSRVATVNDLATSRFDWEQGLRDLSRALPADVTLSQLSGSVSSTTSSGGGASSLRGALDVPAIELQGCTRGQTDVARLMARLRNVDGVTRVSLAKSDKEAPTARSMSAGAAASSSLPSEVNACGVGAKPTFTVIVFFEGKAAAAVQPSVLGATATTASTGGGEPATGKAAPTPAAGGAASTPASATTTTQGQSK
jgi:Tfp pilus assembly protein PilN